MRGILRRSAGRARPGRSRVARVHRTTTAATLLLTMAVSALTGCVTVQRPASGGPGPGAASAAAPAPRPEGGTGPRAVQAPAREALERADSSGSPEPPAHPHPPAAPHPAAPAAPVSAPAPRARHPHPHPAPHSPGRPAHRPAPARPPAAHHGQAPAAQGAPPAGPGVCALGKQYGGWRANSPEAKICGQTYGR
nr:hypothetical protein StreXyl84_54600 [Streptomyces sp. Xyl84]